MWTFLPWPCFWQIPVFQRGGTVIPLKTTAGKSTEWMIDVSYELHVALDTEVLGSDIPFTKLSFTAFMLFLGACSLFNEHSGNCIWISSGSPLLFFIVRGLTPPYHCFLRVKLSECSTGKAFFWPFSGLCNSLRRRNRELASHKFLGHIHRTSHNCPF